MLWSKIAVSFVLVSSMLLTACQMQPLYSNGHAASASSVDQDMRSQLAGIIIAPPSNRNEQILRNRLIYLLGNSTKPQENIASYQLEVRVTVAVIDAVRIDIGDRTDRTGRASAGTVRANASYRLLGQDGSQIANKRRTISTSFDRPRQEYANLQAEEDAKRRALEELAEQIYLSLAQDMAKNVSSN